MEELFTHVPPGVAYFAKNQKEEKGRVVSLGESPSFSSPWQRKSAHSVTLKLGISWWTPPGWGLFFTSAVHRNEDFRIAEGFVRTDLWHRDIPIVVQPLREEIRIPKYSVVASALAVLAEGVELLSAQNKEEKIGEIALQTSYKRMSQHYYKALVRGSGKKPVKD